MSTQPIIPDDEDLRRQGRMLPVIPPFQATGAAAGLNLPAVGAPIGQPSARAMKGVGPEPGPVRMDASSAMPSMNSSAPQIKAPLGTVDGDTNARSETMSKQPWDRTIASNIENSKFGQAHPTGGKVLGNVAQFGGALLDTLIPRGLASRLPFTEVGHQAQLGRENAALTQDTGNAEKEAQTENLQSLPELHEAQLALNQEKQQNTEQNNRQKIESSLNEHGFTTGEDGKIVPLPYEKMSEPQKAVHDLKASQEELADATAALKKAQTAGIPAQVQMAQQRINVARQNATTAAGRLGLSGQELQFREQQAEDKQDQPPVIAQGRAAQGTAIVESSKDLKAYIDSNPEVFGNLGSYWDKFINNTPISDPAASKAMAKIASFAALQPALHGMRSHDAMREFESMIGGIPKNAESLKAAIDGLVESAAIPMIHAGSKHGAKPAPGGVNPQSNSETETWVRDKDGKLVKQ